MINMPPHAFPKYMSAIIFAGLIVFLANAAVFFFVVYRASQLSTVAVMDATKPTINAVCPGDTLDYRFTINVSKPATVDVSTSFHPDGGLRPSYVRLQQFIFTEPTKFVLVRHSVIPEKYTDPETGVDVSWQPGKYSQRTTVNIEGRSSGQDLLEVPFEIKRDCE